MPEDPRGPVLTPTIKEWTISVKHVFSAFTLYANVLRRVKVPFDEAQQEFIRGTIHWNLPKRSLQLFAFFFFFPRPEKLTPEQSGARKTCLSQEWGSFESGRLLF